LGRSHRTRRDAELINSLSDKAYAGIELVSARGALLEGGIILLQTVKICRSKLAKLHVHKAAARFGRVQAYAGIELVSATGKHSIELKLFSGAPKQVFIDGPYNF